METRIIGICETMCPPDEIAFRTREGLLHFFERIQLPTGEYVADESKVIKEFSRSAAGVQVPTPKDLRTIPCLKRTINYLLSVIIVDKRKPFNVVYDFIFDRLWSIRQEMVIQDLDEVTTIELMEPIIMFFAFSMYSLVDEPIERFDPRICSQHMQECIIKVLNCYDILEDLTERGFVIEDIDEAFAHREIIESLYILHNLGNGHALARGVRGRSKFLTSTFKCAYSLCIAYWSHNYYRCLMLITSLPYILCGVVSLHVQSIRRKLVEDFSSGYNSKVLLVSLDFLKNILLCDSVYQCVSVLQYYGLNVDVHHQQVNFRRDRFLSEKPIMRSRKEHFVDVKLVYSIEDMLLRFQHAEVFFLYDSPE